MTKWDYHRQRLSLAWERSWSITRHISTAAGLIIGSIVAAILLFPSVAPYIPTWGFPMANLGSLAALFLVSFLFIRFAFVLFVSSPYQIHKEQEKKINGMKKELDKRAALEERCRQFAYFIDQGRKLHQRSNKTRSNFPDKDIENWINEFEKYVRTLDSMYQSEWEKEHKNESIRADAYPGGIGENHKLYDTFTSRLTQSENMLARWREQSEQHGFVQRETNSTIP